MDEYNGLNAGVGSESVASKAYILTEATIGRSRDVARSVQNLKPAVSESYLITGPYDVIAVLESESLAILSQITVSKIHTVEGVVRTLTCVATTPP